MKQGLCFTVFIFSTKLLKFISTVVVVHEEQRKEREKRKSPVDDFLKRSEADKLCL